MFRRLFLWQVGWNPFDWERLMRRSAEIDAKREDKKEVERQNQIEKSFFLSLTRLDKAIHKFASELRKMPTGQPVLELKELKESIKAAHKAQKGYQ